MERRQLERSAVAWPVRLWVRENTFIAGRTVDASIYGTRVLLDRLPVGIVELNDVCDLTVCPGGPDEFHCVAVVRHLGHHYGVGLEVKEELPISVGSPKTTGRPEGASLSARRPVMPRRESVTILVVDDEPSRRQLLTEYLADDGYRVIEAHTTAERIFDAIECGRPEVIVLDMGPAGTDALGVLRRIRREAPTIAVIILIGNRELALARLGFDLGAADCLFKPFDLDRLGQAVTSSIELAATPRPGREDIPSDARDPRLAS